MKTPKDYHQSKWIIRTEYEDGSVDAYHEVASTATGAILSAMERDGVYEQDVSFVAWNGGYVPETQNGLKFEATDNDPSQPDTDSSVNESHPTSEVAD